MCYNHLKNMLCNLKIILLLIVLFISTFSFHGAEKSDINIKNNFINIKNTTMDNINNSIKPFTYTGFQSSLYRSGLYMIGFGGASGMLGGALFGLSYLLKWYCANSIGWSYESVVLNIFFLESIFNIHSYYATIAIAFWISGIVLMALSVMIIPGIILMVIDMGTTAKRLYPLKEAVGFAIKF